jgi:hypothetical protein
MADDCLRFLFAIAISQRIEDGLARTITKVRQVRRSDSYFQIDAIVKNERGVKTEGETQD